MKTREQLLEEAEQILLRDVDKSQEEVFQALTRLLTEFDKQGGKIQFNSETVRLINDASKRIYASLNKSGYDSRVKLYLKDFDKIKLATVSEQKLINGIDVGVRSLNNIQKSAIEQTTNILLGNGLDANLTQPVKDILLKSATSGMTTAQAELQLREVVLSDPERLGKLEKHVTQVSRDAVSQYDGMMQERIAKDYDLDGVSYEGSIIRDSRAQCKRWADIGELAIADLDKEIAWAYNNGSGMIPGTTKDNFMINRGGYNCRHTCTAIRL